MEVALNPENAGKKLLPYGGVAARLDINHPQAEHKVEVPEMTGRAFCFLSLPVLTGFPVHVRYSCGHLLLIFNTALTSSMFYDRSGERLL